MPSGRSIHPISPVSAAEVGDGAVATMDDGSASSRANTTGSDALHFSRSGGLPAHVASIDPSLFRYAQICDAVADRPAPTDAPALIREARTGRLLPGEGVLPLMDLVRALPDALPLAIEAPCRATAELPALERAKRAYAALTALVSACDG
jgi:hypothetical protein